jgi:starch synthase
MKIALISPEAIPYSKTGGLADVAGTLFREYSRMGLNVSLFVPLYKTTAARFADFLTDTGVTINVTVGSESNRCRLFSIPAKKSSGENIGAVYFISNEKYFGRNEFYGTSAGDYPDNAARFAFFSKAVLGICKRLGLTFDILHCNDWQTALIPLYVKTLYQQEPLFKNTRTIFTIHNLGYQGIFPPADIELTGLGKDIFTPEGIEFYGNVNFMKAGIIAADMVTTVSPTYAKEILTPEYGFGLDGLLRTRKGSLYGVLNGIDYNEWNPAEDSALPASYSAANLLGKKKCKQDLISHCSFTGRPEAPVLSLIGRLSGQKGIELITDSIKDLMRKGLKLFILGKGEAKFEKLLLEYASRYPGDIYLKLGFDDRLAHLAYAGSDIFLMPSLYEPCGLGQMIAMRYGTLPVAFNTGGLSDSIIAARGGADIIRTDNNNINGFLFNEHTPASFLAETESALQSYGKRSAWGKLIRNAMSADFSWAKSANRYIELYKEAMRNE